MTDVTTDVRNSPPAIPQHRVWYCLYKGRQYGPYLGCKEDAAKQFYISLAPQSGKMLQPDMKFVWGAIEDEEVLFWTYGAKSWYSYSVFIEAPIEDYVVLCRPATADKEPVPAMTGQEIIGALAELVRLRVSVNELKTRPSDGK